MRHPHPAARARGATRTLLTTALTLLGVACSDPSTPVAPVGQLSLAKGSGGGGGGPSVSSASPAYSRRDTTLDVRILGSGFSAGAVAEWSLGGIADPAKIRTNGTQYISSSELIANITVSADADLAFWDISITLVGGKKGVGTEKFEVTTATILGEGTIGGDMMVQAVATDLLSVTGYAQQGGVFVYDGYTSTLLALGAGQGWGIDPSGTTVLGRDNNFMPMEWVRGIDGTWTRRPLPSGGIPGVATRAVLASDGTLLASGWISVPPPRGRDPIDKPVLWRRTGGTWAAPLEYAYPGLDAAGYDVSADGRMAGRAWLADNSVRGVIWDSPTSYTLLDGIAFAINDAGTLVVGERGTVPVYWYRDQSTGAWTTVGTVLPTGVASCTGGRGRDVTNSGLIVGGSCGTATVWQLDLSASIPTLVGPPTRLGLLGVKPTSVETGSAAGTTAMPPYTLAGGVVATKRLLVSWSLP